MANPPEQCGQGELIYFLHIPKTSGTSLTEFLHHMAEPDAVSPPMLWDHLVRDLCPLSDRTRVYCGHFAGLLPLWLRRWPRILTILRDPVARALSAINHVRRDPNHPWHASAGGLSVLEFCDNPAYSWALDNIQARYLASLAFSLALVPDSPDRSATEPLGSIGMAFDRAIFALDKESGLYDAAVHVVGAIDAVGVAEAHCPSLRLIAKKLGWQGPVKEHRKMAAEPGQVRLESLSAAEVDALTRLNTVDIAVYRYALSHFRAACRTNGIELEPAFLDWAARYEDPLAQAA